MNFKLVGGSLSALLLAAALSGCTGGGNSGATGGDAALANVSDSDVLAKVGDSNITRETLDQTLEGIYGDRFLPQVIDNQILANELKAKNITLSDEEITKEQARIVEQDPTVKTAVDAGGSRLYVIRNQVVRNLTLQKLLTQDVKGDPAKEKAFFDKYASFYGTPTQFKVGLITATTKVRIDQILRSLKDKPDSFDALVAEQKGKGATDQIAGFSRGSAEARFAVAEDFAGTLGLPAQIAPLIQSTIKALGTAKTGQVLPPVSISPKGPYLVFKVLERKDATKPNYDAVKEQVAVDYKMAQVAEAEIKKNPGNPQNLEANVKSVIQYLGQPSQETNSPGIKASFSDALTFILRPASNTLLQGLRTKANVQISDAAYKDVASYYQQPTAVPGAPTGNSAADGNAAANTTTAGSATTNTATANTATTNTAATNTAAANSAAPSTP